MSKLIEVTTGMAKKKKSPQLVSCTCMVKER